MPDDDSFAGGTYPTHRYKAVEGTITISFDFYDTFSLNEEDEDIRQIIEDNWYDFLDYKKAELENIDMNIYVDEE